MTTFITVTASNENGEDELNPYGEVFHTFAHGCGVKVRDYTYDPATKVASAVFELPIGKVDAFCTMIEWAGDMSANIDRDDHCDAVARLTHMEDAALGKAFKRYLEDSDFGNWEGYSPEDIEGVDGLLRDLVMFIDNGDV